MLLIHLSTRQVNWDCLEGFGQSRLPGSFFGVGRCSALEWTKKHMSFELEPPEIEIWKWTLGKKEVPFLEIASFSGFILIAAIPQIRTSKKGPNSKKTHDQETSWAERAAN